MNESVIERSLDMADTEDVLSVLTRRGVGRTVVDDLLFLLIFGSLLSSLGLKHSKEERPSQNSKQNEQLRTNISERSDQNANQNGQNKTDESCEPNK